MYSLFFEGIVPEGHLSGQHFDHVPQPFMYVLNANDETDIKPGDPLVFGMRIFGTICDLFPYVAFSLFEAGNRGIGQQQLRFELDRITQDESVLYQKPNDTIKKPQAQAVVLPPVPQGFDDQSTVELTCLTPLRMRHHGTTVSHLTFVDLTKAALRRISIVNAFYGDGKPPFSDNIDHLLSLAQNVIFIKSSLVPFAFDRYSGRQERKVRLDGVLGNICFSRVAPELLHLLRMVELIGLGKSTSFGFGRVRVLVGGE